MARLRRSVTTQSYWNTNRFYWILKRLVRYMAWSMVTICPSTNCVGYLSKSWETFSPLSSIFIIFLFRFLQKAIHRRMHYIWNALSKLCIRYNHEINFLYLGNSVKALGTIYRIILAHPKRNDRAFTMYIYMMIYVNSVYHCPVIRDRTATRRMIQWCVYLSPMALSKH